MPTLNLTPHERSDLRAAAHALRPAVLIGDNGLTEAVLKEISVHLQAHQLIKIRVAGDDREARLQMLEHICQTLDAAAVHHLGKILTIYRPNPERPHVLGAPEKPTRAVRKPSEPYTPKKLAAAGVNRTRSSERARRAEMRTERSSNQEEKTSAAARSVQKFNAVKPAASRSATRRPGSAMSLRAGARRGPSSGKR
ncbi:MAG TPA: YhbY family RNA-binding protein [Alcaligenes sp.]|nr:YhbY family RNA-binding protein [Alcaligenes sp.]HRL27645.1 YhbY family RNA-binding protein [Alcaligenes sp.]